MRERAISEAEVAEIALYPRKRDPGDDGTVVCRGVQAGRQIQIVLELCPHVVYVVTAICLGEASCSGGLRQRAAARRHRRRRWRGHWHAWSARGSARE